MSDFFETVVKNFSGLSSETKPTIAAGNNIPNGSRWREVDTLIIYTFNLSDDTWYINNTLGMTTEGTVLHSNVQDNNSEMLLTDILKELKKMNLHLALMTDNYITNAEVE